MVKKSTVMLLKKNNPCLIHTVQFVCTRPQSFTHLLVLWSWSLHIPPWLCPHAPSVDAHRSSLLVSGWTKAALSSMEKGLQWMCLQVRETRKRLLRPRFKWKTCYLTKTCCVTKYTCARTIVLISSFQQIFTVQSNQPGILDPPMIEVWGGESGDEG